jgi:hydrogenase nickel incorporation protein HypA/HybF
MHELSVAHGLVQTVSEALEGSAPCRVRRVRLRVGVLSGVVAEAIEFCYDVVTRGTALEGSVLEVRTLPLVIHCGVCQRDVELPNEFRFRCPTCGTASADIRQGKELEVESLEVEDEMDLNDGERP